MIEMGDPFQAFIYGQVLFPLTIALKFGIKLIFRGENAEAEYGGSPESWNKKFLPMEEFKKVWFSNYALDFWLDKGFTKEELISKLSHPYNIQTLQDNVNSCLLYVFVLYVY